jgi:hypothetical protein
MLLEAQEQDQGLRSRLEPSHARSAEDSSRKVISNDLPTADHSKDFVHARTPRPQERPVGERRIVELPLHNAKINISSWIKNASPAGGS